MQEAMIENHRALGVAVRNYDEFEHHYLDVPEFDTATVAQKQLIAEHMRDLAWDALRAAVLTSNMDVIRYWVAIVDMWLSRLSGEWA